VTQATWAKWVLPTEVDPAGRRCFVIYVPDEQFHIAAFRGALLDLGSAYKWADDDAHTAKDVAQVWRTVIDNMESCVDINIRLKPTDFCMLQLTLDGGATWSDVADLSDCAHAAAVDEIGQAIDRGDLAGGGQQPGQGEGTPGQCYDYHIQLSGNGRWISPVAVEDGDVITVDGESGAWWDGDITHNWQCADGSEYFLGECSGAGGYTQGTDPAPSVNHMRLIGNLPADTTTPFFDMFDTTYHVPSGVPIGDFYLQANDDLPADNQGSIGLHVQICKNIWTHHFDFTAAQGGWVDAGNGSSWSSPQGWLGGNGGQPNSNVYTRRSFSARPITQIETVYTTTNVVTSPLYPKNIYLKLSGVTVWDRLGVQIGSGTNVHDLVNPPAVLADEILIDFNAGNVSGSTCIMTDMVVQGGGAGDPM